MTPTAGYREPSLLAQTQVVAWRSVRRTLRTPRAIVPPIIFPLLLLTLNSAGLADAPKIPGFPADRYLDFALVVTFMQAALFASSTAGIALGQDIESGFLNRLALTPMRGSALVFGQLAGACALALIASFAYVAAGFVAGVDFHSGLLGVLLLIVFAVLTALAFAGLGAFLAIRAGTAEAVQGLFPVLFASLFLSTMAMPLDLMENGWFHAIARANPVTYLVDGMRSLIIFHWDWSAIGADAAVLAAVTTIGVVGASRSLRGRLTRT